MHRSRAWVLQLCLAVGTAAPGVALTFGLDFVTGPTTDAFGVGTAATNFSNFGFVSMTEVQIREAILDAVIEDFLGYPTVGVNPLSPLQNGLGLNIDFVLSASDSAPLNGDTEYFYVAIGDATGSETFFGQACLACVRTATGTGPIVPAGTIVSSVLTSNLDNLAWLAASDHQRINLIAGTVSHEIGHTLSLDHPNSARPNPGESAYDLLATGLAPTSMPDNQRVLNRAFAYSDFGVLIDAVGTEDAAIPEPGTAWMLGAGLAALAGWRRLR